MPTTTIPTVLSYDGFGLNGDDEYKSRLLTFPHSVPYVDRQQLGPAIVQAFNTHAALVAALERLYQVYIGNDPLVNIGAFIQDALAQERSAKP